MQEQKKCLNCNQLIVLCKRAKGTKRVLCNLCIQCSKCLICDLKIAHGNLSQHIKKVHNGYKPAKCEYCDFKCSDKFNLRNHSCYLQLSRGEKPDRNNANHIWGIKGKHTRRARTVSGTITKDEYYWQKVLEKHLNGTHKTVELGTIDILTDSEIIEIKKCKHWMQGLGQLITYSQYYPDHQKILYLFDLKNEEKIEKIRISLELSGVELRLLNSNITIFT